MGGRRAAAGAGSMSRHEMSLAPIPGLESPRFVACAHPRARVATICCLRPSQGSSRHDLLLAPIPGLESPRNVLEGASGRRSVATRAFSAGWVLSTGVQRGCGWGRVNVSPRFVACAHPTARVATKCRLCPSQGSSRHETSSRAQRGDAVWRIEATTPLERAATELPRRGMP
jgi:hypothetical protein